MLLRMGVSHDLRAKIWPVLCGGLKLFAIQGEAELGWRSLYNTLEQGGVPDRFRPALERSTASLPSTRLQHALFLEEGVPESSGKSE
eukprot:COSAG05_NODE_20736_length_277_cov_0.584270_1_plen_86_part_01